MIPPGKREKLIPQGKRENMPRQKGKRESTGTTFWTRFSLYNQTARTHARTNETKRNDFPVGLIPPTSRLFVFCFYMFLRCLRLLYNFGIFGHHMGYYMPARAASILTWRDGSIRTDRRPRRYWKSRFQHLLILQFLLLLEAGVALGLKNIEKPIVLIGFVVAHRAAVANNMCLSWFVEVIFLLLLVI